MGIIIATLIVLVVIASVVAQDFSVFSWAYWQEGGSKTSRSEVFRNFGLFFVAVIALGFGIWRAVTAHRQAKAAQRQAEAANEQARIAGQGHITERFSRAVEQLGHDRVAVRIGGIYALKRIAEDSVERDHLAVMDVLTNFIRQPPYAAGQVTAARQDRKRRVAAEADQIDRADQTAGAAEPPPEPELIDCPDIVAAIEIIQGRSKAQRAVEGENQLSLTRAGLSYLRLPEVDLRYFNLTGANLTGTLLARAKLMGAELRTANLERANLARANLAGADLTDANLWRTELQHADLTSAILTDAINLTQYQLDFACIIEGGKPPTLPEGEGLNPPQDPCPPRIW